MRENRTCGSEGGEAQSLPYPYPALPSATRRSQPCVAFHTIVDVFIEEGYGA